MTGKPPYFPFYPKDFAADHMVEAMSTAAVGAYILLLCKAWHQDPPASLPSDDHLLARWARMSSDDWSVVRLEVLGAFVKSEDGRYHQRRLRREYDKFVARSKSASKSAKKRWENKADDANAMRTHSEGNARASGSVSDSDSDSVNSSPSPGITDEQIYQAYPRKAGKQAALRAIAKAVKSIGKTREGPREWLLQRVNAYAASPSGQPVGGNDSDYRPHPASWFNAGKYDDDEREWQRPNGERLVDKRQVERDRRKARECDETGLTVPDL